jgi:hypothetical protein
VGEPLLTHVFVEGSFEALLNMLKYERNWFLKREITCVGDTDINRMKAQLPKAEVVCGCV